MTHQTRTATPADPAPAEPTAPAPVTDRLAVLRRDLYVARDRLEQVTATAERLSRPRNECETDMAVLSGVYRKPRPRAVARRDARYEREAAAWQAVRDAQLKVDELLRRIERAEQNKPTGFTRDELNAAKYVRDRHGWHKVARVSAKSVSVETGYDWTDRIPLARILEVRS